MVDGDVRVRRDGRATRQRGQLKLGQLVDDAVLGRQVPQPLDQGAADVAAQERRMVGMGVEHIRRQRRGGGLSLRASHPDRRRRAEPQEQVGFGKNGRDLLVAGRPRIDDPAKGVPEPRLRGRVVRIDGR
jgi:hypothetical protein